MEAGDHQLDRLALGLLLVLWGLIGCSGSDWRNADLQIDVEHAGLDDTDLVRICVEDVGLRERPVHAGTVSFPGLPLSGGLTIRVDHIEGDARVARAGPVVLGDGVNHRVLVWTPCEDEECAPCTIETPKGDTQRGDRLLAVRFLD